MSPYSRSNAMRLLAAIYEKTGGRSRGVRDVAELPSGLDPEQAKTAWRDLLALGLIERFSQDYAARLSSAGVEFVNSGQLRAEPLLSPTPPPVRKVFLVRGSDSAARDTVARFVREIEFEVIFLDPSAHQRRSIMEQAESHGAAQFAIILLTTADLGAAPDFRPQLDILMELGFFLGRLGRSRVCALAIDAALGSPADLAGVVLESLDESGNWKTALRQRMLAAEPVS